MGPAGADMSQYWEQRISSNERHRSVGLVAYPDWLNERRKASACPIALDLLARNGVTLEGLRVLDAGCGTGIYSAFYAQHGAEVHGVDFSPSAIQAIEDLGIPGEYQVADISDLPFDAGAFDLTHCFSVLYHIVDGTRWRQAVDGLARVTRDGGWVLLRIEWIDEPAEDVMHHVVLRSRPEFMAAFEENGLKVVDEAFLHDMPRFKAKGPMRVLPDKALFRPNVMDRMVLLKKEGGD